MRLLGSIMDKLVSVGVLVIIIIFQDEIRKFLYNLGAHQRVRSLVKVFKNDDKSSERSTDKETIIPIVMACMNMARRKVGALIVIERNIPTNDSSRTSSSRTHRFTMVPW